MRIAVFSDIHSCYSKMAAVFEDMENYQIDRFICLGDIIGYGDQPEKTINLLMEKNQKILLNVGSIGFSRDDIEASKYAVYDSENKKISVRMVDHGTIA